MQDKSTEQLIHSDVSRTVREAMTLKWLRSLHQYRNTPSKRLSRAFGPSLITYINEHAGLGVPLVGDNGAWGLQYWNVHEDGFFFVPLTRSDADLHPFFEDRMKCPSYWEGPRAIFLPPDRFSQTWRSLLVYHEVSHAFFHQSNMYRDEEMGYWVEEYEIYVREMRLVRTLYGKPYSRMAYQLSKLYELELRTGHLSIEDEKAVPRERMERIFGKSQSTLERGIQRGVVILDALYRALDRIHADGDKAEHYEITRWFHGINNEKATKESSEDMADGRRTIS